MKPAVALAFAFLILPASIAAQNPAAPAPAKGAMPTVITTFDGVPVYSCPVAMHARQGSGGGLVMVRKQKSDEKDGGASPEPKPSQQIHLILGKMPGGQFRDPSGIASATVTVKGLSARGRLDRTLDLSAPFDLKRTMNVTFVAGNDGSISADLTLPGFTSVNSVKLDSVALKDGSTWALEDLKICVVTPDRMMLVANQ